MQERISGISAQRPVTFRDLRARRLEARREADRQPPPPSFPKREDTPQAVLIIASGKARDPVHDLMAHVNAQLLSWPTQPGCLYKPAKAYIEFPPEMHELARDTAGPFRVDSDEGAFGVHISALDEERRLIMPEPVGGDWAKAERFELPRPAHSWLLVVTEPERNAERYWCDAVDEPAQGSDE